MRNILCYLRDNVAHLLKFVSKQSIISMAKISLKEWLLKRMFTVINKDQTANNVHGSKSVCTQARAKVSPGVG